MVRPIFGEETNRKHQGKARVCIHRPHEVVEVVLGQALIVHQVPR